MSNVKMITRNTTYDELDYYMKRFRRKNVTAGDYIPSRDEIVNILAPNFEKYMDFIYWLLETSSPTDRESIENKRFLMWLFNEDSRIEDEELGPIIINSQKDLYEQYLAETNIAKE